MSSQLLDVRRPSWSVFTTPFPEGVSAREALEGASMREIVVKAPLYADVDGSGEVDRIVGKYAMLIPGKHTFLGIAGEGYDFLQNEELADLLDQNLTSRYPVIAAGNTPDGAGAIFVLRMGKFAIRGEEVDQYFTVAEARTVGVSLKWAITPTRIQCMNTLMTAFHNAAILTSVQHNSQFRVSVAAAAKFAINAEAEAARSKLLFNAMSELKLDEGLFTDFLEHVYPLPSTKKLGALEAALEDVTDEFSNNKLVKERAAIKGATARANQFWAWTEQCYDEFSTPALRGTAWAAYNAVVEVQDFLAHNGKQAAADSLFGTRAATKNRALSFFESILGVP